MPDVVSIVACGPSALKCGAERAPGFVIAVNDAYKHVRHDAVLSMDGRWLQHRVADGDIRKPLYARRSAWAKAGFSSTTTGLNGAYGVEVVLFNNDNHADEFSHIVGTLNGANSGYCALNLAWQMRPKTVWLFGYDHRGNHFHPENEWRQRGEGCSNTPRKFAEWSVACYQARRHFDDLGCRVFNTNRDSLIRAFRFADLPK